MMKVTINLDYDICQLQMWFEANGKHFIQWLQDHDKFKPACRGIMDRDSVVRLKKFLDEILEEDEDVKA